MGEDVRILIVEDDADARETYEQLLSDDGYTVRAVGTGEQALAEVRDFGPACVLVDFGLPGIDGIEVTRRLRQDIGPELVLIAITGSSEESDRTRAEDAGIDFVLTKPVGAEHLHRLLPPIR
ncbi:response regulator [Rhizobacter sp. LjRoot28]|jgi:CheY-like chemotaxis protein|uniref:response regulator n=1 Tax=Rhizobacter sp. LjRoot28 TaxID=3342309 RepID=UPI003ECCD97D